MIKQVLLFVVFFVSFLCSAQEDGTFVANRGHEKVTLVLDTKLPYVELNKPVIFETYFEYIDLKKCITIARRLKKSGRRCEGNCAVWQVIPDEKGIVDGHFKVTFVYRLLDDGEPNELYILIPVKQ